MKRPNTRMDRYKDTRVKRTKIEENIDNNINNFKRSEGYKGFLNMPFSPTIAFWYIVILFFGAILSIFTEWGNY